MGKLEMKLLMANLPVHQAFSTFKVIMSHTSFDTHSLFWEVSKDAYHLPVIGPRTRKPQPAATGCMAAKVKLLRRDKIAIVHRLQADTGPQFRTVYIHISLFLALNLLFFLYPVSCNSRLSSRLLPEILRFTNAYLTISFSFEKCWNPHRLTTTFQLLRLA